MDKIPSGSGVPPGADGAFERFLTAAIATIITIMFSWRLLAEEEEAASRTEGSVPHLRAAAFSGHDPNVYGSNSPSNNGLSSASISYLSDIDTDDSEDTVNRSRSPNIDCMVTETVISDYCEPVNDRPLGAVPSPKADDNLSFSSQTDDSLTDDTLTTWDEYKWEEELGEEKRDVIKTKRSVRDFVRSANNSLSLESPVRPNLSQFEDLTTENDNENTMFNNTSPSQEMQRSSTASAVNPSVPFSQRFANFEYKDMGGHSGYIDLYPDIESDDSDSSDDEHVYEIQVSDSDSESEDERGGGSFFGVTALDTILEEYESDISDGCDRVENNCDKNARSDEFGLHKHVTAVGEDSIHDKHGTIKQLEDRIHKIDNDDNVNSNTNQQTCELCDNSPDKATFIEILEPEMERIRTCEKLQTSLDSDTISIPVQNVTVTSLSEAEKVEYNLSPDKSVQADDKISSYKSCHTGVSKLEKECDLSVNNTASFNSGMQLKCEIEKYGVTENNTSVSHNVSNTGTRVDNKTDNQSTLLSNIQNRHNIPKLKLTENEKTISELSDDSLPPSPVRTCALDNLGDEPFSDTESCSSSSVITVLSVKSTDSDYLAGDRYDVTRETNPKVNVVLNENAQGNSDQSLLVGDSNSDSLSPYENNSLVSGFLNDSLNSLLSGNTGSSESVHDPGYEKSEQDTNNFRNDDSINGTTERYIEPINETQSSNIQMNGCITNENSSAESLPSILANGQLANQTNTGTYNQNNQNVNGDIEIICEDVSGNSGGSSEQIDGIVNRYQYDGSDNSSDSSDPPLREYDPDDDDLAAYQFNIDSDDEDSFFLIVGDEGGLRNFETCTNLNSIGLSPEYSDAVTSRTVSDDGRVFKFSVTENESTEFRKRTYFTDRQNLSDSDAHSDGPLSPILSEDEGNKSNENESEINEPLETSVNSIPEPKSEATNSKYDDASLSIASSNIDVNECNKSNENVGIDFQKYIIQTESNLCSESPLSSDESNSLSDHKDPQSIDEENTLNCGSFSDRIDAEGVNGSNSGVNDINNEIDIDGHSDTLASLTQRIRNLSLNEDDFDENLLQNDEVNKTENVENSDVSVDREKLEQSSIIDGIIDTFNNSDVLESDFADQTVETSKTLRKETEIDAVVDRRELNARGNNILSQSRETNIDDIITNTEQSQVEVDKSDLVETCIYDEITEVDETKSENHKHHATVETNIDDLFEDANEYMNKPPTNSNIETNIDDIFVESAESKTNSENNKLETDVDNDFDLNFNSYGKETKSTTKSKVETNIDDIFDDVKPLKSTPVQSTQLKVTNRNAIETNVDDLLKECLDTVNASEKQNSLKSVSETDKDAIETFVDDLFKDVIAAPETSESSNGSIEVGSKTIPDKVDENSISYETFVDDLFENIVPLNASQSYGVQNVLTSESAAVSAKTITSDLEFNEDAQVDINDNVGVKEENNSSNTEQNFNNTSQTVHSATTKAIADLELDVNKDSSEILHRDYGVCIDPTTDNKYITPVKLDRDDYKHNAQDCIEERQTAELIENNVRRSDYQNRPQSVVDRAEISDKCDQNNSRSEDSISDIPDKITTAQIDENKSEWGLNPNNALESKEAIKAPVGKSGDNIDIIPTTVENDLNGHNSGYKDYNGNVALPKGGILKEVIITSPELGLHPDIDKRCNYTGNNSSLEVRSPSVKPQNNIGDIQDFKSEVTAGDIELKIVEDDEDIKNNGTTEYQDSFSSIGSCSIVSDSDASLSSLEESYHSLQDNYNSARLRGLSESAAGKVIRTPLTKPSELFGKPKELQGVKKRIRKHQLKKYTSILQQPVTAENVHITITTPETPKSLARLKVLQSRQRFLSAENLSTSAGNFEDKFLQHRTSLITSTPRKYLKRHERHLTELQSTESLPTEMTSMSLLNTSYDGYSSMDRLHSLPTPRHIDDLYASRNSSANSSYERAEYDKLHANCIFSPHKREEIQHTTKSLENMFEQLLRYGSVSSLAETDLDADVTPDVTSHSQSLHDDYLSFQYPLERAASMSALIGSSDSQRLPRKPGGGRFASRNVPKSKSLQTLETNLDDVFADENEFSGELKKTPSVHELRVSKSLSKLTVPDWFKKSSFSRSGSTQSLFTYAGRQGSTSTLGSCAYPPSITSSPSPSVTPGSNAVVIQKRVTPSPTTSSSARLIRAPMLPTTPEKAPIHNTSSTLPSDKYRKKQTKKDLKPIPIIPFAKLREMFEKKSVRHESQTKSPVQSPTKEKPPKVRFETASSPTKEYNPILSPKKETVIDSGICEPVQNHRTTSPPPPLPDRKPIIAAESVKYSETVPQRNTQPRRTQVHFSDEQQNVSNRSQERNLSTVRQNGATPQTTNSTVKKPSSLRTSLPLPQFRFRRPGVFATKAVTTAAQNSSSTQSKKGKDKVSQHTHGSSHVSNGFSCNSDFVVDTTSWVHALERKAKTDGETLFEFLQKRRYSSLLENGFAEQLEDLQDRDVTFNFPVLTLGKHSNNGGIAPMDGSPELQVILTNAYADSVQNGFLNNKLLGDASLDDILDGLLIMDGHSTGRMRIDENGRIVPKKPEDVLCSPDTPPGLTLNTNTCIQNDNCNRDLYMDNNDNFYDENEIETQYVLVKCQYSECKRETNLKEAKKVFKTCHSCYTYYCSRSCRKHHWETHKKVCIYSRINSACKHVIKYINRQPHIQYQCSRVARRGYLAQGRGCVMFAFPDISSAEDFLSYGMDSLWVPPMYVCLRELPNATMLSSKRELLTETCKQYNPELKYVIHVAIVIPPKLPVKPIPRKMETIIQKCAKLRLSPAHMHPKQDNSEIPSTLILTAVPGNQHVSDIDGRKTRELCFINIQRKLRQRGVSLRHQFAEVYNKLIDFVSDAKHFSPLIIYPVDGRTGKRFMCVIMPEAEPEIEWIRDPDLFHELDVFEDDEDGECTTPNLSLSLHEAQEIML